MQTYKCDHEISAKILRNLKAEYVSRFTADAANSLCGRCNHARLEARLPAPHGQHAWVLGGRQA